MRKLHARMATQPCCAHEPKLPCLVDAFDRRNNAKHAASCHRTASATAFDADGMVTIVQAGQYDDHQSKRCIAAPGLACLPSYCNPHARADSSWPIYHRRLCCSAGPTRAARLSPAAKRPCRVSPGERRCWTRSCRAATRMPSTSAAWRASRNGQVLCLARVGPSMHPLNPRPDPRPVQ